MHEPTHGVVAAGDPQSAEAGARCLRLGGNALDAAVGAGFAAFVCELPLASPLGGGVLVFGDNRGELSTLEFFARTPGLDVRRPDQLDFENVEVDFGAARQIFHVGRASAAVPLALPGLIEAHRRWGRLPLTRVVEPAIELGRAGYVLSAAVAYVFDLLRPIITLTPDARALFSADGQIGAAGAHLKNPDLADCLERIAAKPALLHDLYAELCKEFSPSAGGLLSARDVTEITPVIAPPIRVRHRGWELCTMPAPSSGGVLVALGLRLLESAAGRAPFLSPDHLLGLARVQDVLLDLRDPDFDERCRSPGYVRDLLDEHRIALLRAGLERRGSGVPGNRLGSTTHISALDEHGGAASLTLTNGEGSGYVLRGTGMHMNNLLGEEDIHPRGFHRDAPGTRLVTMMAPTVLRHPDGRRIALGSGGSNRLRNAILSTVSHLLDYGASARQAVDAARLHLETTRSGRQLAFERSGLGEEATAALRRAYPGALVFERPNMFFGGVHAAVGDAAGFTGAGDARRGGSVALV